MLDPARALLPSSLHALTIPFADRLSLFTLPYHIHEVLLAFVLYQGVQSFVSPVLSRLFIPSIYNNFTRRTRINWDVHVVSLLQSCIINVLALWVIFTDHERYEMRNSAVERVYGYTGASGLIQGLACGYFLWDLVVSTRYYKIFGPGILAHAVTALLVFSFGFRPFCNYYGPVFILYELSSPFLNIHWFCDKLNLTGSKLQWYNGMLLLVSFFGCRLIWGTYNTFMVYKDVWAIFHLDPSYSFITGRNVTSAVGHEIFSARDGSVCLGKTDCVAAQAEVMKFVGPYPHVPLWIIAIYAVSNTTLNALNFYWFGKMVETVRKRFEGKPHDEFKHERGADAERRKSVVEHAADSLDADVISGAKTPATEKQNPIGMSSGVSVDGGAQIGQRRRDL